MLKISCIILTHVFHVCFAQNLTFGDNSTTNSTDTNSESSALPVLELVIVAVGLSLLVIASVKLTSLIGKFHSRSAPELSDSVECAVCAFRQAVSRTANIFVCCGCHSANVILREAGAPVRNFSPSPVASGRRVSLHKVTDTFYKIDKEEAESISKNDVDPAPDEIGAKTELEIDKVSSGEEEPKASVIGGESQCTVCMDAPADTVMIPCAHGGICYACAEALVRKHLLNGGAKCIHCRTTIESLVRLSEMHDQVASGIEIDIPKATLFLQK